MRKPLLCIAFAFSAAFAHAEVANLVPNGDLDTASPDDSTLPANWKSAAEENDEAHTKWAYEPDQGKSQAWLGIATSGSQGLKQWKSEPFNLVPEQKYRLSFSYQTDAANSYVRIDFWGDASATQWKGMIEIKDTLEYNLPSLAKTQDWKTKKETFTSPAGAAYATVSLIHQASWGSTGFDEIKIEEEN